MKKVLSLISLCALALGMSQAFAAEPILVEFRTQTNTTNSASLNYQGFSDSTVISNTGTAGTYVADTTEAIPLSRFLRPVKHLAVAGDSSLWFYVYFVPKPNSSVTVASDSVYITMQVSFPGALNWQSVTPGTVFYPDNQMPTSTLYDGPASVHLEQGSVNGFYSVFKLFNWGAGPAVGATTAPTYAQLAAYAQVRFVVIGDWGGEYQAYVRPCVEMVDN